MSTAGKSCSTRAATIRFPPTLRNTSTTMAQPTSYVCTCLTRPTMASKSLASSASGQLIEKAQHGQLSSHERLEIAQVDACAHELCMHARIGKAWCMCAIYSAIDEPGGDTYTPNSGIWQTVWLEPVPETYITDYRITPTLSNINITVYTNTPNVAVKLTVGTTISTTLHSGVPAVIDVPNPSLWSPSNPVLYNFNLTTDNDNVRGYFALRTFKLCKDNNGVTRPCLNDKPIFMAGWLDQSYWPDGIYTAPTDEALAYDVQSVKRFGLNMIRLHQKVNPQRWYHYADTYGIIVLQDMIQHYGSKHNTPSVDLYMNDLTAMLDNVWNHPSIVQYETFNEADMWTYFDVPKVVDYVQQYDPSRLVDADSGGKANDDHVGDVNDVHDYPQPGNPQPLDKQYAMVGEFGGIGAFVEGKEWWPHRCHTYLKVDTPAEEASTYIAMTKALLRNRNVSASVYTQITDVELECDGFLNYDRSDKFDPATVASIAAANQALINAPLD
eukprot:TRINITY_DN7969_c0_g2_i3.p1 TRINITY_DN7969_c0_g2~~TRINITY_DN7969_c0_g2_i3.p1  ORF type:complete len:498 (+),score=126.76 TRINITY_DN7969_c0_g2_i3:686-2179(+)